MAWEIQFRKFPCLVFGVAFQSEFTLRPNAGSTYDARRYISVPLVQWAQQFSIAGSESTLRLLCEMEYRFRPITKTCAGTGKPLVPGAMCYSVLVERNGQQERLDFSDEGWQGIPDDAVGFWRCQVPAAEGQSQTITDPEVLLKHFEILTESPNPMQEKLAYVLALSLLQKRRLKLDGTTSVDGVEFLELSGTRGEGPYLIRDQQLSAQDISEARRAIDQQLLSNWDAA